MKFWQRQFLLSLGLFCFVVVVFLHSRTPDTDNNHHNHNNANNDNSGPKHRPWWNSAPKQQPKEEDLENKAAAAVQASLRNGQNPNSSNDPSGTITGGGGRGLGDSRRFVNQTSWDHKKGNHASPCAHILRPDNVSEAEPQRFQHVIPGDASLLEYSAFLDLEQSLVRLVGLGVTRRAVQVFCLLWFKPGQSHHGEGGGGDGGELEVVEGRRVVLPEHHGRKYAAHYIECPVRANGVYPYAVSLTTKDCRTEGGSDVLVQPHNVFAVLRPPLITGGGGEKEGQKGEAGEAGGENGDKGTETQHAEQTQKSRKGKDVLRNFTVCVTALNYRYSRAYELVEMIEFNRLLGADLLTFYVNSVGDNVRRVLNWYQERGIVELLDWDLPMIVDHWPPAKQQPEVHYFGQLASHNDCLNRHRGRSRWLVYQDLDEFIVPKTALTWGRLLDTLRSPGTTQPAGYIFKCIFFRKDWPPNDDNYTGKAVADKYRSIVLNTDKREPSPFDYSHRAKYMVDPSAVQVVGIHNVWRYRTGREQGQGPKTRCSNVPQSLALLHHYRSWENPADKGRAVRDRDVYRFRENLLSRLQERWGQLPPVPLDVPLSDLLKTYGRV